MWQCGGVNWRQDEFKDAEKILVKKNYKEIKPHSSEENEDNVVEGEIYNDENDEYV